MFSRLVLVGRLHRQPGVDDRPGGLGLGALQAHHQHVGVVPAPRALGDPRIPGQRGAHAGNLVRRHRRARAGPAEEDALVGLDRARPRWRRATRRPATGRARRSRPRARRGAAGRPPRRATSPSSSDPTTNFMPVSLRKRAARPVGRADMPGEASEGLEATLLLGLRRHKRRAWLQRCVGSSGRSSAS